MVFNMIISYYSSHIVNILVIIIIIIVVDCIEELSFDISTEFV